jgi:predicted acyltransferase
VDAKEKWNAWKIITLCLRATGMVALVWLAFAFRGAKDQRIITLSPFHLDPDWYGILGLIGWAYLVAATVYLVFRGQRTAIVGSMVLLLCLFAADKKHLFDHFWLNNYVGIGETLGSGAAITVGGLLLGSMLAAADLTTLKSRAAFTFWFGAGCAAAALLLHPLYGISKNNATPSWCLWACAITAALWFVFYLICDVRPVPAVSRPLALAGQNVLLAYLLSELLPGLLGQLHLGDWYWRLGEPNLACAIMRAALCGGLILLLSVGLNRIGFKLKL